MVLGADGFGFNSWQGSGRVADATGSPPATGDWHHLALVRDGDTVSFYVDGVLVGSNTDTGQSALYGTAPALTVARAHRIPVLGWGLPREVAEVLNQEYSAAFAGHAPAALPIVLDVDRERQGRAIAAHASQAVPGSVLWRRLELLGSQEHLRLVTWSDPA